MTPGTLYFKILEAIEKEKPNFVARNAFYKQCRGLKCFCPLMLAVDPEKRITNQQQQTFVEFIKSELGISALDIARFYRGYDCPMSKSNHPFTKAGRAVYRMLKRMGYTYDRQYEVMAREEVLN